MQARFLKPLLFCTVLLMSACSKDEDPDVSTDFEIAGTWQLDGRLPLLTTEWQAPLAEDTLSYTFIQDGTYTMHSPHMDLAGTYNIKQETPAPDNAKGLYRLTLHLPETEIVYKVELMADNRIRLDDWSPFCGTGYTSNRFKKISSGTIVK